MPVPEKVELQHYRGDTFGMVLRLWDDVEKTVPSDLSNATTTAQVRAQTEAADVLESFEVGVVANEITLILAPAQTRVMPETVVFDCQVDWQSDDVNVQTVIAGTISFGRDVTRV